jgi:hypothetical protein
VTGSVNVIVKPDTIFKLQTESVIHIIELQQLNKAAGYVTEYTSARYHCHTLVLAKLFAHNNPTSARAMFHPSIMPSDKKLIEPITKAKISMVR